MPWFLHRVGPNKLALDINDVHRVDYITAPIAYKVMEDHLRLEDWLHISKEIFDFQINCMHVDKKRKSGDSSPCSTDSEATTDQDQDQNEWSSSVQIQQSRPQWLVGRPDQPSRARAATRQPGQLLSLRPRSAKSKGCCQPGADSGRDPRLTASSAARVSVVTSAASGCCGYAYQNIQRTDASRLMSPFGKGETGHGCRPNF